MISTGNVRAVVRFELQRALSRTRLIWWAIIAAFPVALTLLIQFSGGMTHQAQTRDMWATVFFLLIPMAVCMLGTLLYASSVISSELERKSWTYLAVRPHATRAVLLGKYIVAVIWAISAALAGLTYSCLIAQPAEVFDLWIKLAVLIVLSSLSYASVYLVLGTLFYKRAMVAGVAYTLLFELAASFIPAVVNKLTIQFRLRALFIKWADIDITTTDLTLLQILGDSPPMMHILSLIVYTLVMLLIAQLVLRYREFTVADEATT